MKISTHNSTADWYIIPPASGSFVTNVYDTNPISVVGSSNARKNDSSIRVTFNGDNMAAGNDYVKYRSTTVARNTSLTVRPVETENISSTINISQAGYSWEKVYVPSETAIVFAANEVEKTFTVKTNYDVDFTLNTSIDVPANALVVEGYDLTGNKFADNDDNNIQKTFRCTLKLYCNPETTEKNGKIIISQKKHGTEDNVESKEITFRQTAPGNLRSLNLKNIDENRTYTDGDQIEVTSLATILNCKVISVLSGWNLTAQSEGNWIHVNTSTKDFSRTSVVDTDETNVTITIDEYSNVTAPRYGSITLTSKEDPTLTKTFNIYQTKADLYFKLIGPFYDGGEADPYNKNTVRLVAAFENVSAFPNKTSDLLPNDEIISCEGKTFNYYFEFFKGSAQSGIGTNSSTPDGSEINGDPQLIHTYEGGERFIYYLTINVTRNPNTTSRNDLWFTVTSRANNNIYMTFQGKQEANEYKAEGNINFVSGSFIGQNVDGNYIIPVYGGDYRLTLHNELTNDTIRISSMTFTSGLVQNADRDDTHTWGTIEAEGGNDISASGNKVLNVHINPYYINEDSEARTTPGIVDYQINTKYYGITITCCALSSLSSPYTFNLLRPDGGGTLIAEQKSEDLTKTDSWELLSPVSSNGEPQRVYCINDFVGANTDKLYSMDTGITVKEQGTQTYDDEIPEMQTIIMGLGGTAIDKRFGVR